MFNLSVGIIAIFSFLFFIIFLFLMIFISWLIALRSRYWVPFDKTVALLALLIGGLPNWYLYLANLGETTDEPKT